MGDASYVDPCAFSFKVVCKKIKDPIISEIAQNMLRVGRVLCSWDLSNQLYFEAHIQSRYTFQARPSDFQTLLTTNTGQKR